MTFLNTWIKIQKGFKMTQMEVAERLDYVDNMNELEVQRQVELYDKHMKYQMWLTSVIMVLVIVVVIVATYQLVEG